MQITLPRRIFRRATRAQSGMAMVTTMLVLMGVMAVTLLGVIANTNSGQVGGKNSVLTATGNTMQMSMMRTEQIAAFNLAESGVVYTVQWLGTLGGPPSQTQSFPCRAGTRPPAARNIRIKWETAHFASRSIPTRTTNWP